MLPFLDTTFGVMVGWCFLCVFPSASRHSIQRCCSAVLWETLVQDQVFHRPRRSTTPHPNQGHIGGWETLLCQNSHGGHLQKCQQRLISCTWFCWDLHWLHCGFRDQAQAPLLVALHLPGVFRTLLVLPEFLHLQDQACARLDPPHVLSHSGDPPPQPKY